MSADDDTVSAAYNGNPSQVFHLIPWKIDTIGAAAVTALVEIIYTVSSSTSTKLLNLSYSNE